MTITTLFKHIHHTPIQHMMNFWCQVNWLQLGESSPPFQARQDIDMSAATSTDYSQEQHRQSISYTIMEWTTTNCDDAKCRNTRKVTTGQPQTSKSLSSEMTTETPPWQGSNLLSHASWASASYGATMNSTISARRACTKKNEYSFVSLLELRRITSHVGISTKTLSSSTIVSHSEPLYLISQALLLSNIDLFHTNSTFSQVPTDHVVTRGTLTHYSNYLVPQVIRY